MPRKTKEQLQQERLGREEKRQLELQKQKEERYEKERQKYPYDLLKLLYDAARSNFNSVYAIEKDGVKYFKVTVRHVDDDRDYSYYLFAEYQPGAYDWERYREARLEVDKLIAWQEEQKRVYTIRQSAIVKLTPEERDALGLE